MPMFGGSQFEKLLNKATDEQVTEPDWMAMMAMCDLVRQQETAPSVAIAAIRKQLFHRNSQVVVNSLLVLECLVKNCGQPVHEEVTQYEFLEELKELVRTGYSTVRAKVLSLIASWHMVFKGEPRYNSVKECFDSLKSEGFQFPELNDSEDLFDAARAPDWEDGRMCHLCRQLFTMTKRKHHCRNCGQIFCAECTSERITLPHYGIEKDVRVCSICADKVGVTKKVEPGDEAASVASRQPAVNPQVEIDEVKKKKQKDLELKEKEEFDLAIALSLSQEESRPSSSRAPSSSAPRESAPAENMYAEVEHLKPEPTSYYPDLTAAAPISNGMLYPTVDTPATTQQMVPATTMATTIQPASVQPAAVQSAVQPPTDDYAQQIKDLSEMLMRKLNMAAMKGQHVGTDPHIQTLLASLTALHPRLVTSIEDTERKMITQKTLLTKISTCKQARESLNKMREEHLAKVKQQEEEQTILMRLQMEQKLELMRQQKLEQLKYQEELKRKHEQALVDKEMTRTPSLPQTNVVMSTHVNPSNYVMPQPGPQPQQQPPPTSSSQHGYPYQHLPQLRHPQPQYQNYQQPPMTQPQQPMGPPQMRPPQMGPPQHITQPNQPLPGPPRQGDTQQYQPRLIYNMPMNYQPQYPPPPQAQYPTQLPQPQYPTQPPQPQYPAQPPQPPPVSSIPQTGPPPPPPPPPQLSNQAVLSALDAAPAPPTAVLPAPREARRGDPPVADLISF